MIALEGIEEHRFIDFLMERLQEAPPENEPFDAKFRRLVQSVEHLLEKEESELFLEQESAAENLDSLGVEMGACIEGVAGSVTGMTQETIKALPGAATLLFLRRAG
jgi:hypothetical protein